MLDDRSNGSDLTPKKRNVGDALSDLNGSEVLEKEGLDRREEEKRTPEEAINIALSDALSDLNELREKVLATR
ncbi:hypothetical protein L1987_87809 [Smallanthus sonchifolius]|nr:hypothetical protein L1987_87809 [Smallanthus sonchifolius]